MSHEHGQFVVVKTLTHQLFSLCLTFVDVIDRLPPHLHGISFYGDNIQDEWFIVGLLFHISKAIPGLIVRTFDSDGEFMLIEAAEHLPEWADPESCENAVCFAIYRNFMSSARITLLRASS